MAVFEIENLINLKTNVHSRNNKKYIKNTNERSIDCKIYKIVSHCAYCKTLLPP